MSSTSAEPSSHERVFQALKGFLSAVEDDFGIVHVEGRKPGKTQALRELLRDDLRTRAPFVPIVLARAEDIPQWSAWCPGALLYAHGDSNDNSTSGAMSSATTSTKFLEHVPRSLPKVQFRAYVDDVFEATADERALLHRLYHDNANVVSVRGIGRNHDMTEGLGLELYDAIV